MQIYRRKFATSVAVNHLRNLIGIDSTNAWVDQNSREACISFFDILMHFSIFLIKFAGSSGQYGSSLSVKYVVITCIISSLTLRHTTVSFDVSTGSLFFTNREG